VTTRRLLLILSMVLFLGGLFLAACASSSSDATATPSSSNPAVSGSPENLVQERCTECHSLQRVTSAHKTQAAWEKTVRRMVSQGARLNDAEFAALVEYLAANYK
jgi:cytochrome c5